MRRMRARRSGETLLDQSDGGLHLLLDPGAQLRRLAPRLLPETLVTEPAEIDADIEIGPLSGGAHRR